MHRSSVLTASALLGLALLAPAAQALPASAGTPVCDGEEATVVGTGPTVTGTEGDDVIVVGPATTVDALGGDDEICLTADGAVIDGTTEPAATRRIDAGAGSDLVQLTTGSLAAGSSIDLGDGTDMLVAAQTDGALALDLGAHTLSADGSLLATASGVEDAYLLAPDVTIVGDQADNELFITGCDAVLRGGRGNDVLWSYSGDATWDVLDLDCDEQSLDAEAGAGNDRVRGSQGDDRLVGNGGRDRIEGRGGDDAMTGSTGADVLEGGGGRDRVDGARGRDRCVAEVERRCER